MEGLMDQAGRRPIMLVRVCLLALAATGLAALVGVPGAGASKPAFGIESFSSPFTGQAQAPFTQAGGHPYAMTATIALDHEVLSEEVLDPGGTPEETLPTEVLTGGDPKNARVILPQGVVVDAQGTPTRCTEARLEEASCPASSAVGVLSAYVAGFPYRVSGALYNMLAPSGVPAQFASNLASLGFVIHLDGRLDPANGYALSTEVRDILRSFPVYAVTLTLWGDPSDPGHDAQRGACAASPPSAKAEGVGASCPSEPFETALLTMPASCPAEPLSSSVTVEAWQQPGVSFGAKAGSPAVTGCGDLQFEPRIEVQPETSATGTPTGLHVDMRLPQGEGVSELATADVREVTVTLPEGFTLNPSMAGGRTGCPLLQGEEGAQGELGINLHANTPANCPNPSKIGEVQLRTPLIAHPLPGFVYLAAPYANPFGSLLAVYVVVDDPLSGVLVKLAGEIQPNAQTGRLTMSLTELPQLPVEDLDLTLWGGGRAPFVTPADCGTARSTSQLTAWSSTAAEPVGASPSSAFTLDQGCTVPGFSPSFTAGALDVQAGSYSPFTLTLSRGDPEQELGSVQATLPPGVLATLAGVPLCGQAQAAEGACPQAAQIGTVTVAAGAGPNPVYLTGTVYLAGPTLPHLPEGSNPPDQPGAPFGVSIEVPATVGPFDLDEAGRPVVIRGTLAINPLTAQATLTAGPFPTILRGIPLHIRSVNVTLDRPGFVLNPTNCSQLQVTASVTSAQGSTAAVSSPFEVANCAILPFNPKLTALTRANGELAGHGASLHVAITAPPGQVNMRSVKVDLPQSLPARLETIQHACPERVFDASPASCPNASVVGSASIQTPILSTPMTGEAILVSHGAAFPNLVLVLQAQGVTIDMIGAVYVNARNVTSVTFRAIPDVPIRRLDMILPEGPRSIFAASASLCKSPLHMSTAITAQDNAQVKHTVKVAVEGCRKPKRPKKKSHVPARRRAARKADAPSFHSA